MTEEEAKTKWCPFARVIDGNATHNRSDAIIAGKVDLPPESYCIGSACMAWRWTVTPMEALDKAANYPGCDLAADGYCGLAGRIG